MHIYYIVYNIHLLFIFNIHNEKQSQLKYIFLTSRTSINLLEALVQRPLTCRLREDLNPY